MHPFPQFDPTIIIHAGKGVDEMEFEGTAEYLKELGLEIDDPVVLAVSELARSPRMGIFERKPFIDGWREVRYELIPPLLPSSYDSALKPTDSLSLSLAERIPLRNSAHTSTFSGKHCPVTRTTFAACTSSRSAGPVTRVNAASSSTRPSQCGTCYSH
jgi:hypothetical protein